MNLVRTSLLAMLLLTGLAVLSCNKIAEKATEKAIEAASGEKVDVDTAGKKMTMTDKETGQTSEVDMAAKSMPEGWPASLPQYPGSTIEMTQTHKLDAGTSLIVAMKTADSPDKVTSFYDEKATAAGFKQQSTMTAADNGQTMYESADQMFGFLYVVEDGATRISLSLTPKNQ